MSIYFIHLPHMIYFYRAMLRTGTGRLFQMRGAATHKARSPAVYSRQLTLDDLKRPNFCRNKSFTEPPEKNGQYYQRQNVGLRFWFI